MQRTMASAALSLAFAAATTVTATTAHAQDGGVSIYGTIDAFAGTVKNTGGTLPQGRSKVLNSGGLTTSFIGFRGSEDLGGGLKAVFALESYLRVDTGLIGRNDSDAFWGRLAMVGLESSQWGSVTVGRHVTPYSLATTNFTPFTGSTTLGTAFANVYRNNVQGDTRFVNSIRYRSPNSKGLVVDAVWSFGQELDQGPSRHRDRALDATVRYAADDWAVVAGTRQIDLNNNDNDRYQKAYMIGGMVNLKLVQLFGQVHDTRETFRNRALDVDRRTYEAGIAVPVGPGAIWASFARSSIDDRSATTPDRRVSWALAYDHPLSKRSDVYVALYSDKQKHPRIDQEIAAVGLRHRF